MSTIASEAQGARIALALVSHTNAGKTTLARTLLAQDVGEVRDAPHVTEIATAHTLLTTEAGDTLVLWDTPGFGDSARLVARLRHADNPLGWLLRELWDRHRDRPLWCSQQAVRAARESADVLLYLVNASEPPQDAGYIAPEMQVLAWIGRPVLALLNQLGPPRPAADERAEVERWRTHLHALGPVREVLPLDAFARCWAQERVLLAAVARQLPQDRHAAFERVQRAWERRNDERFAQSMRALAEQLAGACIDTEPLAKDDAGGGTQKLLRTFGVGDRDEAAREQAMAQLLQRLDAGIRASTDRLIALHGLHGSATQTVLARLRENFNLREKLHEGRTALWSSLVTGALTGLKADLAAGGLTFGAGMLVGGVLGGLAGAGVARGFNKASGRERSIVRFSPAFLDGLVRSAVLRYLAVAHYGRGRGDYVEGEAPAFWRTEVERAYAEHAAEFGALWTRLGSDRPPEALEIDALLTPLTSEVLRRLYPVAP
jgi:GTPase Era involved in 16S rRNA processing